MMANALLAVKLTSYSISTLGSNATVLSPTVSDQNCAYCTRDLRYNFCDSDSVIGSALQQMLLNVY